MARTRIAWVLLRLMICPRVPAAAEAATFRIFDHSHDLPVAFHQGAVYEPSNTIRVTTEGTVHRSALAELLGGLSWRPGAILQGELGYRPAPDARRMSAGIAASVQWRFKDCRLSYAVAPLDDRGPSHYLSVTGRFAFGMKRRYR
jgi:hypothetical protein